MDKLTIREFWCLHSKQYGYTPTPELPERLSYGIFFDILFGKLVRHKILALKEGEVLVECMNCLNIANSQYDVCEAHIGILQGQFEKNFSMNYKGVKSIDNGICRLRYLPQHGQQE